MAALTDGKLTVTDRRLDATGDPKAGTPKEDPVARHRRLMSWFQQEMRRQSHNRFQMALDEDYYDSEQWRADEIAELEDRGQAPTVYNEVKPMIDWLIGVERRTRVDFKVYAREETPDADAEAQAKTKLLKYLEDVNRSPFERSAAADDQFKAGVGWIEIGVSPDPEDEPIYKRHESWRNMLHDSLGPRRDLDDSRYLFRFKAVDLDVAQAYFPNKDAQLRASLLGRGDDHYMEWWNGKPIDEVMAPVPMPGKYVMFDSDAWATNVRDRVLLIECWHYEYVRVKGRVSKRLFCTVMTELDELLHCETPYKHNKFPFIPYWCYRRKKDQAPYGPIRPVRGPQDALNKRVSKALFVMSTNQTWIEKGAVDNKVMPAEEVRDESQAPDGFIILADGGLAKVKTVRENDVAQGHLQLAQLDQAMIRNGTGVSDENLNRTRSVQSGVALRQKDEQGTKLTAEIFDNQLLARQLEGEIELSLIEQFYTEPKVFSIAGERGKREYVKINQPGASGQPTLNDVTAREAQFVIGEQAWKQTLQQAAFESLMELLSQLAPTAPQVVMALLDVVFELADIPNKQTVVSRIRGVTGFTDPDQPLTPEEQQQQQQKKALNDMQMQAQFAQLRADIAAAEAKGQDLNAGALKKRIETLYVAMQAAQVVQTVPGAGVVGDNLLASVGFDDRHPAAQAQAPAQQPAQQEQPSPGNPPPAMPVDAQGGPPQPALAGGEATGIETPRLDGTTPATPPIQGGSPGAVQ